MAASPPPPAPPRARLGSRRALGALALAMAILLALPAAARAQRAGAPLAETDRDVTIVADQIQHLGGERNLLIATGNVEVTRGDTRLVADRVEYDRDTGEAVALGNAVFHDGPDRVAGSRIEYNLRTGTGVVHEGAAFATPYYSLRGRRMARLGESVYEVQEGTFTTCEGDLPDWAVKFGSATVDLNDLVWGRDASFWVRGVPLIPWVPFFAAAIRRERQSGFLFPTVGASTRKGAFVRIPYFWAIDDSQDLTVSLDVFSRRGAGAEADYRYVLSERARGHLGGFFVRESLRDDEDRGWFRGQHEWRVTDRMAVKLDSTVTSDDRAFREYADRLHDRTLRRAETNLFVSRRWESWNLVGNVLWYQDLTTSRPVELQRVPDIRLTGLRQPVPGVPGLLFELESSAAHFVRDVGSDGLRLDLHPRLLYPVPVAGLFTATPFLGGRLTYYDRRVVGLHGTRDRRNGDIALTIEQTVDDDRLRRQVEGGLDLETRAARVYPMDGRWNLQAVQHVVEPRVTWLEIRGEGQKGLPQYDPAVDRIGKVSQVTYSVTNRLNAKTVAGPDQQAVRWEAVRLLLSQTVNLLPEAPRAMKALRGDLLIQPGGPFAFRGDAALDVHGRGFESANAEASVRVRDVSVAVSTRFTERPEFHYVKGEVQARLTPHLLARASTSWDVVAGNPVENRAGIEFQYQCWALMLEYIDRHRNEDEVRFSVNLLGLGQVGSRLGTGLR